MTGHEAGREGFVCRACVHRAACERALIVVRHGFMQGWTVGLVCVVGLCGAFEQGV